MPEWAIYVLIAVMWIIGVVLVIAFVLIMYFIFGKQLKKLGFRVSVKDGIGVDVETHQPQISPSNTIEPQKILLSENLPVDRVVPKTEKDNAAPRKSPEKSISSDHKSDLHSRVKKILETLKGQEFSGTLFGKKVNPKRFLFPNDERLTFSRFERVSFLSKTQNMPMDILAETNGGIEVESLTETFSGDSWNCSSEIYQFLYAICLPNLPDNYDIWYGSLEKKLNILSRDSIIWVIINGNFPEHLRYKYQNPRILTSTLADIEVMEIEIGHNRNSYGMNS